MFTAHNSILTCGRKVSIDYNELIIATYSRLCYNKNISWRLEAKGGDITTSVLNKLEQWSVTTFCGRLERFN